MSKPLYDKRGSLTKHAFECGYVERKGSFLLYREASFYHVLGTDLDNRLIHKTTWLLKEARKMLNKFTSDNQPANHFFHKCCG